MFFLLSPPVPGTKYSVHLHSCISHLYLVCRFRNSVKQGRGIRSIQQYFTQVGKYPVRRKKKKWAQGFDSSQFSFPVIHFLLYYLYSLYYSHSLYYSSCFQAEFLCFWVYRVKNMADNSLWVFWFPVCSTRQRKMTYKRSSEQPVGPTRAREDCPSSNIGPTLNLSFVVGENTFTWTWLLLL